MLCYGCGVSLVVVVEGLRRAAYVFGIKRSTYNGIAVFAIIYARKRVNTMLHNQLS